MAKTVVERVTDNLHATATKRIYDFARVGLSLLQQNRCEGAPTSIEVHIRRAKIGAFATGAESRQDDSTSRQRFAVRNPITLGMIGVVSTPQKQ
jgi:hypothetical protein